jgi:hypothetical protein
MKKLPFYIVSGVAVAAVSALIIVWLSRRRNPFNITKGPDYLPLDENSAAAQTFKGFNYNLYLSENTKNAEPEITALQHLLNAYYGTQTIPVTGIYDVLTANAVEDITGKSGISLFQFRYYYFDQLRGDQAAVKIFESITD